jgi:hypothetical protein
MRTTYAAIAVSFFAGAAFGLEPGPNDLYARVVDTPQCFRTDRGDDEGGEEWDRGRINGCSDTIGDDDIDVILPATGGVRVAYRRQASGC